MDIIINLPEEFKNKELGENVAKEMGILKYEPQISGSSLINKCKSKAKNPEKYTDIENWRANKRRIDEISQTIGNIVLTEKLHGTSSATYCINGKYGVASMNLERQRPTRPIKYENMNIWQKFMAAVFKKEYAEPIPFDDPELQEYIYWIPFSIPEVKNLIDYLSSGFSSVVVYGELYGNNIQKGFVYDTEYGKIGYRIFDIKINGRFVNFDEFVSYASMFNLKDHIVPVLYYGPYNELKLKEHSCGQSIIGNHIREGCVMKPIIEQTHPKLGRIILKIIGEEYDLMKNKPDCKDN